MRLRSATAVLLLSIVAAACGSSEPAAAPASIDPEPAEATTEPTVAASAPIDEPTDDGGVSAAEIVGRWSPVAVDGVALDPSEGDYWDFRGTDAALEVRGFDGCNNFGTVGEPDTASASIADGRLENVEIATEEMACEGIDYGPYPEDGAQLTVSDDGTTLTAESPSGSIELSRTEPVRANGDTDAPETPDVASSPPSAAPVESEAVGSSVDGPLMRYLEPSGTQDGMAEELRGVVVLDDCLYLSSDDTGERYPVLWPAATAWDAEREVVVLPSGEEIAVGGNALGGGGYLSVSAVETIAGAAAGEHAARCVDNTYGEVAVVNNDETAIAPS